MLKNQTHCYSDILYINNNNYQTHTESRGQLQLPVGVSRIRVERKRITYGNLWIYNKQYRYERSLE